MRRLPALLGTTLILFASGGFAQTRQPQVTTDNHTVTVSIPVVLRLTVDATDVLFDFSDDDASGDLYGWPRASLQSYITFLEGTSASQRFAPSEYAGATNDYVTARVVTNQDNWELSIESIGAFNGALSDALEMKVGGGAWAAPATGILTDVDPGGQGRTNVAIRYRLTLAATDNFDSGDATSENQSLTVSYKLASP